MSIMGARALRGTPEWEYMTEYCRNMGVDIYCLHYEGAWGVSRHQLFDPFSDRYFYIPVQDGDSLHRYVLYE